MTEGLDSYVSSVRADFEHKLREWVEIPTVSALPERRKEIRRGAEAATAYLKSLGASVRLLETSGNPVVLGTFATDPSYPKLTIYNHLDVQPADEPEWKTDPFRLVNDSGTYTGRGTTDDKGPALTALMAARFAVENEIPINIQFIWELEEEIGSPNFEAFVRDNLAEVETDSIVVSDTIWISRSRPAIPFALRGLLSVSMTLATGAKDVHSGLTGGGARNPLTELCTLVAKCYDPVTDQIQIPGFYDDVLPIGPDEIEGFLESGFNVETFRSAHELHLIRSTDPSELVRRIWTQPTFEVHGLVGGYRGPGVKTAIPPRAEAKVSMRLVPDQSPMREFERLKMFVLEQNPDVRITLEGALAPFLGARTGLHMEAAREAMQAGFGTWPASVREGGSIGAVVTMHDYLKAPILFLGLSLPEHGYHAPNENFDWAQAAGGIRMFVKYFENVARLPRARSR